MVETKTELKMGKIGLIYQKLQINANFATHLQDMYRQLLAMLVNWYMSMLWSHLVATATKLPKSLLLQIESYFLELHKPC